MDPNRTSKQIKEERLVIVAELRRKGKTVRGIAIEVMKRMGLEKPPSTKTIFEDIQSLLKEWRKTRIDDIDLAIQEQIEQIDYAIEELWDQWEKSKTDQKLKTSKRKGDVVKSDSKDDDDKPKFKTREVEDITKEEINLGDYRYIAEIRAQQAEKRKLLGLYAPEKKELTGKDGAPLAAPITFLSADKLTDEQIEKFLNNDRTSN